MTKEIVQALKKTLEFLVCLALLDLGLGTILGRLFFAQTSGKFFRIGYTMDVSTDELMVFGSSHAAAHYVPAVLEEELGLTSYNAGIAGQQILVHETLARIVLERTAPKVMILDLDTYGFYDDLNVYARLSDLHPFYARHPRIIGKALALESPWARIFLTSRLYRYNSTVVHILRYGLSPQPDEKGYRATFTRLTEPDRPEAPPAPAPRARRIDENLMTALDRFVANARDHRVPLVLAISPNLVYDAHLDEVAVQRIRSIASRYEIPLLDAMNDPAYIGRYDLFADAGHLNDVGARLYSRSVAQKIRAAFPAVFPR